MSDEGEPRKRSSVLSLGSMITSIVAAGVSGAFTLMIAQDANDVDRAAAKAQADLTTQSQELQRQIHSDERELRIVEQVMAALRASRDNPAQLQAASALVYRLPDDVPLRCQLAEILVEEELRTAGPTQMPSRFATRLRIECVSEEQAVAAAAEPQAAALAAVEGEAAAPGAAAPPPPSQPAVQIASRELVAVPNPTGWDVDVFWCSGAGGDQNLARANRVGETLAEQANAGAAIAPGVRLGRVRVRELREALNRRPGYSVYRDELRAEGSEDAVGRQLIGLLGRETGSAIERRVSTTSTPYYISVFMCSAAQRPADQATR